MRTKGRQNTSPPQHLALATHGPWPSTWKPVRKRNKICHSSRENSGAQPRARLLIDDMPVEAAAMEAHVMRAAKAALTRKLRRAATAATMAADEAVSRRGVTEVLGTFSRMSERG